MFNNKRIGQRPQAKKTINAAGGVAYQLDPDKELFLQALSFRPRNSYYWTQEDYLKKFQELIDTNYNADPEFTLALAWFLGNQMGVRLAPTIMVAHAAATTQGITFDQHDHFLKVINDVFTRPDFLANALGYIKFLNNTKSIGIAPVWFKAALREALASFKPNTLIARKMRRRDIQLKDLIKVLRPRPKTPELSALYRSIIEDGPASKLSVKVDEDGNISADKLSAAMSEAGKRDSKVTMNQVRELAEQNIHKIPVNEFIRNLAFFKAKSATDVYARLVNVLSDPSANRFVNPFDLIFLDGEHSEGGHSISSKIVDAVDRAMSECFTFQGEADRMLFMFDHSGSMTMSWSGPNMNLPIGTKYMSVLKQLYTPNSKFIGFANDITDLDHKFKQICDLPPNAFAQRFKSMMARMSGGTALLHSLEHAMNQYGPFDGVIIITDEDSWNDPRTLEGYKSLLPRYNLEGKAMVINVDPKNGTMFEPDAQIFRLAGIHGRILDYAQLLFGWKSFKASLKKQFNS